MGNTGIQAAVHMLGKQSPALAQFSIQRCGDPEGGTPAIVQDLALVFSVPQVKGSYVLQIGAGPIANHLISVGRGTGRLLWRLPAMGSPQSRPDTPAVYEAQGFNCLWNWKILEDKAGSREKANGMANLCLSPGAALATDFLRPQEGGRRRFFSLWAQMQRKRKLWNVAHRPQDITRGAFT